MQRSISSVSVKLATLTAALALCGAAYATTGTPAPAPMAVAQTASSTVASDTTGNMRGHHHKSGEHHKGMRHHMADAAMWVPGYGPLNAKFVDSLALTDSQSQLLKDAQAEQKASRSAQRDAMKSARADKLQQIKGGKIDPHAALKQSEETRQQAQAERNKIDGKWLAVWDALDAGQQQKITANLNERTEKFAKRAEERKQRHDQRAAAKLAS
ncbi:hypothetical protein H0A66_00880 [Alcaligenaceae bacterium]|nr:hypothetical protein [Alcaligenaceae bacterium]